MRKLFALLLVLAATLVPVSSFARYVGDQMPDGKDCRAKEQATVVTNAASTTGKNSAEPDRFSICLNQGGHTIFYFGGDMQSEAKDNDGFGGTCGAIIVADMNVAQGSQGEDWRNPGPDKKYGTADDHDC